MIPKNSEKIFRAQKPKRWRIGVGVKQRRWPRNWKIRDRKGFFILPSDNKKEKRLPPLVTAARSRLMCSHTKWRKAYIGTKDASHYSFASLVRTQIVASAWTSAVIGVDNADKRVLWRREGEYAEAPTRSTYTHWFVNMRHDCSIDHSDHTHTHTQDHTIPLALGFPLQLLDDQGVPLEGDQKKQFLAKFRQNFARFRLYQNEILQVNMRLTAFFKIYQII